MSEVIKTHEVLKNPIAVDVLEDELARSRLEPTDFLTALDRRYRRRGLYAVGELFTDVVHVGADRYEVRKSVMTMSLGRFWFYDGSSGNSMEKGTNP